MISSTHVSTLGLKVSIKGKSVRVPSALVNSRQVVVIGRTLKTAQIYDEEWVEENAIDDVQSFIAALRRTELAADLFTFTQPLESSTSMPLPFHREPYDLAVVPLTSFNAWWEKLPQESRKNTRKAEKKGVVARIATLDDELVRGIKSLYDETPVRQGRRFWHYGKDLETVRHDNASYLDRADFVTAHFGDELIGFIKIVYVGKTARIMQILAKNSHQDKKTTNLLLTKAVEACCERGMRHFVYGQYYYENKGHTPITEFKRRNGFERVVLNRYFVPLSLKGHAAIALRLHRGVRHVIPTRLAGILLDVRSRVYQRKARQGTCVGATNTSTAVRDAGQASDA